MDEISSEGRGNLPNAVTSFVGRRNELAEVRELLGTARLVTLTGVGGVGKSRFAVEIADALSSVFSDGVWLIDLAVVRESELVEHAVATALGVPNPTNRPTVDRLIEYLDRRQVLLVFDNCEHLILSCAVIIDTLLRSCPGVQILTTSRQVLDIAGEHVYQLAPLPVPNPGTEFSGEVLSAFESVNLLVDRARAIKHGFVVNDANGKEVAQLCAQLEGIPLAIELAVSRMRSMQLNDLVERLEDRFGLLTGGNRSALPRQRTLRALIDWSYDLCTPEERLLWARLSVFAGEFDLQAAEHVCSGDGLPGAQILDLMDHLVAQSVLQTVEAKGGPGRFRMLMTLKEYGCERLESPECVAALRNRHQEYFEAMAVQVAGAWSGPGQEAGLARLRADRGNLESALEWCISTGQAKRALTMVAALRYHWCADGFLSEGRRWLDLALGLTNSSPPERCTALWVAAWVTLLQGDVTAAEKRLTECDGLAHELGDDTSLGMTLVLWGTVELFRGRLRDALGRFQVASDKLASLGHLDGELFTGFQIAVARALLRDERAIQAAENVIAASEQQGEQWIRSRALYALGLQAWMNGQLDEASSAARAGLQIQRGFNDHVGAAMTIELLAWIATAKTEFDHAARLLGAIRSIWGALGTSLSAFGPHLAGFHSRCEEDLQRGLGSAEALQVRLDEGGRLDRNQAIDLAVNGPEVGGVIESKPDGGVLSPRERQVAQLVTEGLSNRQIAERLVVSPRTVDGHLEKILAKLEFSSRAQIAAWVASSGLPPVEIPQRR